MNTISAILIILLIFSFVMPSNAKDLYKKNLGIKKSDTTLQGWGEWRVTGKKQLKKYEKKNKIKLFSVVDNPTRLGDTAFFIQAPGDECFQRKQDCDRKEGSWKRVEAKQVDSAGILGEIWVTYSFNVPENSKWQKYDPHILQFHSGVSEYPPLFLINISNNFGLSLRVESTKGLINCDESTDSRDVFDYCGREIRYYTLLPIIKLNKNAWYDLLFNINFDSDPNTGFFKVWLNGELIIDEKGQTLWEDKPIKEKGDLKFNNANFNFGIYGKFIKNYSQSIYVDEIRKAKTCTSLKLNDLGYSCSELTKQNGGMLPTVVEDIKTGKFTYN